jgi:hypothetical protein
VSQGSDLAHGLTADSGVARDRAVLSCGCELREEGGTWTFTPCTECASLPAEYLDFVKRGLCRAIATFREGCR